MAATFAFAADNGAASGSPAAGTRTNPVTDNNYKSVDDSTTAYSAAPINIGSNSFERWLYGVFTGSFNSIFGGLFAHTATAWGTGLTCKSVVTSSYTTPSATTNASLTTDSTAIIAIGAGATVLFSTVGPQGAGPSSTLAAPGFSQYLVSQLQTAAGALPNDTATVTWTLGYSEN